MLESGRILQQRYKVEKQVGQGGMGSVYLATDQRFHSTVAIKETLFADENLRKAFAREARLLNSLKHSALPKVTDHFIEDNGQYIVMEYIGGDDLFEMMSKTGEPFPIDDVLLWAEQLLDALSYLHDQGIIHRDIKPQNLKLTPRGDIVLLDFGLAKGNPTDANYQTAAQSIFGYSRNYASLEQIQGTGTDPRSDIYSLAATLYHLLTAQVPADALTRVMLVLNENRDPIEPAGRYNSRISQELSDGLNECLALKASERPSGVSEMKKLLLSKGSTPYSDKDSTALTDAGRSDLLTQNTQILDDSERKEQGKPTEFVTEVLPARSGDESIQTEFANLKTQIDAGGSTSATAKRGSKWGIAAAMLIIFGIVGTVGALVAYWPDPAASPELVPDTNTGISIVNATVLDSNANVEDSSVDSTLTEANTGPGAEQTASESAATAAADKPKTTKTAETKSNERTGSTSGTGKEPTDVIITEEGITTRDVTITDGRIIVRPSPRRPGDPPPPPLTREQIEKLTPAQRRRLQQVIEEQKALERERQRRPPRVNPPPD